ncbi:MAG: ADP-ribosylglycohydrolase family protein [Ruminococcaceae bacterium]|nr:ADP-ribosylglycohydrolase family protein [Oscillospiraceae bacterium]
MAKKRSAYRGCLLGLAVGDAMGYTVNSHTLAEIREDYGPNGLQGYDPVNGYADVTSYTQLAAFTANGLLYGLTVGRSKGTMSPFINYIARSHWEWASSQAMMDRPARNLCWLFREKELCRRHCIDTRMKEIILRKQFGTPEERYNSMTNPSTITSAVAVGMFYDPEDMDRREMDRLGMEAIALTHGDPMAYLPGAAVTHLVSEALMHPKSELLTIIEGTMDAFREQFDHEYHRQVSQICNLVKMAVTMSREPGLAPMDAMEKLQCATGAQVLAGAVYALLAGNEDFDASLIIAVNHSGASAAVGALVGAVLGARLGVETLPEFYLECLECQDILRELADDLFQGCPIEKGDVFFDDEWDSKYCHGRRE